MANETTAALASEAEINVALAEAEALAEAIPSLDDRRRPKVVHVPVAGPPLPLPTERPQPTTAVEDAAPPARATEAAPKPDPPPAAAEPGPNRSRFSWPGHALYGCVDGVLRGINWPFQRLSPAVRQLIGLLAIATLGTSLLAMLLLPLLLGAPRETPTRTPQAAAPVSKTTSAAETPAHH